MQIRIHKKAMNENNWLAFVSEVTKVDPDKIDFLDIKVDHRSLARIGTKIN